MTTTMNSKHRMGWWRKAKYGMFIHWGLYSIAGGIWQGRRVPRYSEWLMYWGRIARQEYAKLAKSFNPKKFIPLHCITNPILCLNLITLRKPRQPGFHSHTNQRKW